MTAKPRDEVWEEWGALTNMTPKELEEWLATDTSREVGASDGGESAGHASGRRIVAIKRTRKAELTDADWEHMAKVVGFIKRHCAQGGPAEGVETSRWRYSLMNWGHDPLRDDGCA